MSVWSLVVVVIAIVTAAGIGHIFGWQAGCADAERRWADAVSRGENDRAIVRDRENEALRRLVSENARLTESIRRLAELVDIEIGARS